MCVLFIYTTTIHSDRVGFQLVPVPICVFPCKCATMVSLHLCMIVCVCVCVCFILLCTYRIQRIFVWYYVCSPSYTD